MLAVLSPAKSLFDAPQPRPRPLPLTEPAMLDETLKLMETARRLKPADLKRLMKISDKLAELNFQRFQEFEAAPTPTAATAAALTFSGDTYTGLAARDMSDEALRYAQDHVAILSGLYGVLRPLDRMQPYRLEMGTRLKTRRGTNLYQFWGEGITKRLNALTEGHADRTIVCCASGEYFKAVKTPQLAGGHVDIVFKEIKDGKAKIISFVAKRARGRFARWMVDNKVDRREQLADFSEGDYQLVHEESDDSTLVFIREHMIGPAALARESSGL